MKTVLRKIGEFFSLLLALPLILLFLLFILCKAPVDYIRYRRSLYRKETGEKAHWWPYNDYIRLYDIIKTNNLPLKYLRNTAADITGHGFWITGNAAITPDRGLAYDGDKGEWTAEEEDDEGNPVDCEIVACHLEACHALPGGEHCNFVYLLVDKADVPESAVLSFDTYRIVPYSPKDPLPALEEILKAEKISRS